ncbi:MAG TPA: cytochrome c oxidase assembly protein [Acidimicrobiales bacterium]|nr:cytochrome c oxidase assembly protein [Acidimicrobiales bacterium]
MIAAGHPFDWHLHAFWLLALLGLAAGSVWATRQPGNAATARQKFLFVCGVVLLAAALTWPLGDLASHSLLMALVLQRLLLTLAVPPLLVLGTPRPVIARLTRPTAVDAVLRVAVRPAPAVVIVTVVAVGTLTVGAVNLAAQSLAARVAIQLLVLASGFVLWAPVLTELPGAQRLSALGRGGYLIVQSIVPSFLSIVWIFARHPLYPAFTHNGKIAGMTPLLDQELAGFLAKLSTIAVLWTVAFVIMTRAQAAETAGHDGEPLVWSDVEREIERADRRERRQGSPGPPPPGSS